MLARREIMPSGEMPQSYIIQRMPCRGTPNPYTWNFRFTRSAKREVENPTASRPVNGPNPYQWLFDWGDLDDFHLFSKGVEQKRMKGGVC